MNKKIFATAFIVAAAFVSSIASAAITYSNSVGNAGYAQTANAKVLAGGSAVRGNDLEITAGVGGAMGDIPADAEIIVRLPKGLNFDGAPSYLVTPATATQGLTLKDGTEFQDPTLDDPGITLFDANGDGGMDRAVVEVGASALAGDTLTISVNVTADSTTTAGVKKASVIVNSGLAVTQNVVEVVTALAKPVQGSSGTSLTTVDQNAALDQGVSTATITVTIPAGTANGKTITLTPQSGVQWGGATATSTVTVGVLSPVTAVPVTVGGAGAASSTTPITLTTVVAGPVGTLTTEDIQISLSVSTASSLAGAVGLKGVAIAGSAGITGTAPLFDVKANGSSAALSGTFGNVAKDIVKGSAATQTLPTITVTENFAGDAIGIAGGTQTLTITGGTGLTLSGDTSTIAVNGTSGLVLASASVATNKLTVGFTRAAGGTKTFTISGIKATAGATASGDLSVTVGNPSPAGKDKAHAPNKNAIVVAKAVDVGTVSITGPVKPAVTGPGAAALTSTITLEESTYGALTIANATQVQDAYFRITPVGGASIIAVTVTPNAYPATAPAFTACVAENGVTTGAWLCEVTGESTAITPTTSTVSVAINWSANGVSLVPGAPPAAVVGGEIEFAFDGNAAVAGSAKVADVGVATEATTSGALPDRTPGLTTNQNLAPLTISELFAGALGAGNFRLIAPTGVTFNNAASVVTTSCTGCVTTTPTITATFAPNDTLVINVLASPSITFTPQAIIGPGVSGFIEFDIVDGDINAAGKTGLTEESINLAYGDGTLGALDSGDDGDVNVGFKLMNTVDGGLTPYTVKSGDATIGTASISGDVVTVTGKSVGNVTITVTDGLGATDSFVATVAAGTAQPAAEKATKKLGGGTSAASFTAGASSDGGTTFGTEFTTADDVTIVAGVNVDPADQGSNGGVHVALLSVTDAGTEFSFLNEDGNFETWNTSELPGIHIDAQPLGASYTVTIFSGNLAAGTYRIALAYSVEGGDVVFTGKAVTITVTE